MYANFVVSGSAQDVHVHRDIQVQVHKELEPPYEELFDAVEEHVLHSLLEPWQLHLEQEKSLFDAEVRLKILISALMRCVFFFPMFPLSSQNKTDSKHYLLRIKQTPLQIASSLNTCNFSLSAQKRHSSELTVSSYLNERIHSSTRYRLCGQLLFNRDFTLSLTRSCVNTE